MRAGRALTLLWCATGADPVGATTLADGTRIVLDPRSRTEAGPYWEGWYEPLTVAVLSRLVDAYGPSLYDVGANVGLVGLPVARHLRDRPGASVVAFEPVAVNRMRLTQSIALNGLAELVRVLPFAVGDTDGTASIRREAAFGASSGNAALAAVVQAGVRLEVSEVAIRRLDTVLADDDRLPLPVVVKLDIEGAEALFLCGAEKTLARSRPIIYGEFNRELMPYFGHTFLDAFAALPADYWVFKVIDRESILPVIPSSDVGTALLVPVEKVPSLPFRLART